MDHPLENLGHERFQHLCQALFIKEFPGLVCYPVGQPDGGRDALQEAFEAPEDGFAVFQVKYARTVPYEAGDCREWVIAAATGEAPKVRALKERGASLYLFATNVPGTAHLDGGSIDRLKQELTELLDISTQCWWRDDINRRLDSGWDIKLRYPEVLSGQDFLRLLLATREGEHLERRSAAIKAFLADQYREDEEVKFKQVELQNKLLDLFIDLPYTIATGEGLSGFHNKLPHAITRHLRVVHSGDGFVLQNSSDDLVAAGTATLLLQDHTINCLDQVVVEGAPGQGKSTLAQYVCQVHRIRFLDKKTDLLRLPEPHRISAVYVPFKVDLRDFSEWLAGHDPFGLKDETPSSEHKERTLETFLARLVRNKAGGFEFNVGDLVALGKQMPLLIALDGLDEVADIKRRGDVVSAVSKAIPRLRENCGLVRVIVTSRPAAFANSPGFDAKQFSQLHLGSVRLHQITEYSEKWMNARSLSDLERKEFKSVLEEKLQQPHLRDLSRNPMQLSILLSLIHTRGAALPDKRTALYDAYVDLFFSREATKNSVVRVHLDLLKDIHRYLAWVLHTSAEEGKSSNAAGRLSLEELKRTLNEYLTRERQSTAVIEDIFNAMLERVVMIVSRIEGTYEFEVQPLREYFAARYLYDTASYSPPGKERSGTKPDRFDAIARNFYWLNVARYFCGCFSKGELLDLADRVRSLVADELLGKTSHPAWLCAMLLSDWVFSQSPRAVEEVASMLTDDEALRRLVPRNFGPEDTFRIPESCGGRLVWQKALDVALNPATKRDFAQRLARFVSVNGSSEEVHERWGKSVVQYGSSLDEWFSIGDALGCVSDSTVAAAVAQLGHDRLQRKTLAVLWDLGHISSVADEPQNVDSLAELMLNSRRFSQGELSSKAPFYLVPDLLQLLGSPYFLRRPDAPRIFKERIVRFRKEYIERGDLVDCPDLPIAKKCYRVSCSLASRLQPNEFPMDSSSFWEQAIQDCVQYIGEFPSIIAAALNVSMRVRKSRRRFAKLDLFSEGEPIVDRLRKARAQADDWEFWENCFERSTSENRRFLTLIALWTWAPVSLMVEHHGELSSRIDEMPAGDWATLMRFFNHWVLSLRNGSKKDILEYNGNSLRFAYFVARRDEGILARQLFLSRFVESTEQTRQFAVFRQRYAFITAAGGDLPWVTALSIFKETYKQGASVFLEPGKRIPESIAEQVLASPDEYPVSLWDKAEENASLRSRRRVRPVGKIAKKERWFS